MQCLPSTRTVLIAVLLPGFLAGCAALAPTSTVTTSDGDAAAAADAGGPFARVYTCPDGFRFSARAEDEQAHLDLGTRRLTLAREPADTGTRYAGNDVLFQADGGQATIAVDASIRTGCRGRPAADPWEAAALRGVDVRALGQEPGWSVEVVRGEWLRLVQAGEGAMRVASKPARERTGSGAIVYTGEADGQRLRLRLTESACSDPMSGESHPLSATLTLDGRQLRGCARRLTDYDGD